MHFKWIVLISSCLILSASSARRGGGGGFRSSSGSKGATYFSRPATSSILSSSPRFSSRPSYSGRGFQTRTSQIHRAASAPPLSSFPNSLHVPQAASAPPLSLLSAPPRRPQFSNPTTGIRRIPPPPPLPPTPVFRNSPKPWSGVPKPPPLAAKSNLPQSSPRFSSSPSYSGRGPRPRTSQIHRAASAPPLSSFPNSLHVPQAASAPPLSSLSEPPRRPQFSNPSTGGQRIPPPPPLPRTPVFGSPLKTGSAIPKPPPLPPKSINPTPPKTTVSAIPYPPPGPPLPPLSPKSNLPKNAPKSEPGKTTPSSQAVITPMVVSPIIKIPPKRNTTTKGNSPTPKNSNRKLSNPGRNTTAQAKLPPLNPLQASNNSTGGGSKTGINLAKGNAFNNTIRGSPKNTTKTLGLIGKASGKNTTGSAKPNVNGVPQVFLGSNIKQNFTVSSNQTRYNNTRNATGSGLQASVAPISKTQSSTIGKFPWEISKTGSPQQTAANNMAVWGNSDQKYDVNNGDAPRKPRSGVVGDLTKKIVKSVAARPNNGAKLGNYGLNSGLNGQSWDGHRNEYVWKSSMSSKPAPAKMMKNKIIVITALISVVLIAAGIIVYFCNRN